jgi:multiple sugar transport system substrate-binding protein
VDAATKIKSDRGMPANTELKAAVTPLLKESQQKEAGYLDRVAAMKIEPPLPFPPGSSATMEVLNRLNSDVLFGKSSPRDAAKGFIQEVNQNLG